MPVNWLKLLAFAFGASVAATTGTLSAALNGSVFPQDFEFPLLITIYTMVILGGAGSQAGVVLGRDPDQRPPRGAPRPGRHAAQLFYLASSSGSSPSSGLWQLVVVLGGTLVFGLVAHLVAGGIDDSWTSGSVEASGSIGSRASDWVIVPTQLAGWIAPVSYIGLIALVLMLTLLHGWVRIALLVPTLYLAAFVWENVMAPHPESTRYVVLGAILVAMMVARPQGLLGERRVEIV